MTDKPSVDPNMDSIEQEIPGLFPSCAVTRSMTQNKSTSDDVTTDVDLADTFISRMINDDNVTNVTTRRPRVRFPVGTVYLPSFTSFARDSKWGCRL